VGLDSDKNRDERARAKRNELQEKIKATRGESDDEFIFQLL
jgi:chromosome condensin MukBEF ATPase and DNA-binding subunit MukB